MTAANPSAPPPTGSAAPAPPTRPKRARLWPRLLLSLLLFLVLVAGVTRYMGSVMGWVVMPDTGPDGPFVLVTYLPSLGSFESFRKDQSAARAICAKLNLPELPDISGIDEGGQKHFYDMFNRIRNRPNEPDEIGLLGQLCEAQKFPELAEPLYRRAGAADPGDYRWPYLLGLWLKGNGDGPAAREALQEASRLAPDYAPTWMQLGWLAVEARDVEEARRCVDRYLELRPNDPFGWVERASVDLDDGKWEQARTDLDKAQALGPIGSKGHRCLATLYRHLNQPEDSRFHLLMSAESAAGGIMEDETALMILRLETSRNPLLARFSSLADRGLPDEALQLVDQVLAEQAAAPDLPAIHGTIAETYRRLRRFSEAEAHARKSAELAPQEGAPHATLALIAIDTGQLQAALNEADRALELDPGIHAARFARGLVRLNLALKEHRLPPALKTGDPAQLAGLAREDLAACVEAKPVEFTYLLAAARAEGLLGNYQQAAHLLRTAIRIRPDHAEAGAMLKRAEAKLSFWTD